MKCKYCNVDTTNPKFCSKSCAATWNNKFFIKRKRNKKNYTCKICSKDTGSYRKSYCSIDCDPTKTNYSKVTIGDIKKKYKTFWESHAVIRDHSRRSYKNAISDHSCQSCGYDKHIEVCHIKSLASFPDETTIDIVNSLDNLIGLCPNCHWEYDKGLLKMEAVGPAPTPFRL